MPQIFKVGAYLIYFWANENDPLEPIHVHIAKGVPSEHSTKVWITRTGKCLLCHNKSKIPKYVLGNIMDVIEARSGDVINKWLDTFGTGEYYC